MVVTLSLAVVPKLRFCMTRQDKIEEGKPFMQYFLLLLTDCMMENSCWLRDGPSDLITATSVGVEANKQFT